MKRTTRTVRRPSAVLSALVSLSVAGTCLALPGFALADANADAADDPQATASAETAEETADAESADIEGSQILSFAGVRVDAPLDMEILDLDEANMLTAALPEGTLSVAITDFAEEGESVPEDADEQLEFFTAKADELVEGMDSAVTSDEVVELADGTTGYLFEVDEPAEEEDNLSAYFAFVYVPTGAGSYACVQVTCIDEDVAPHEEAIDAMIASIALAEADEAATAPAVELDQQVEAMGLSFGLPADLEETEIEGAGDELAAWANADGSLTVRAVGDALPSVESPTEEDLTAEVEDLAAILEGEVESGSVSWNDDDTTVFQFVTRYEFEDVEYVTTYGCVVLEDGTTTYIVGDCTADDYEQYAPTLDAIYASIALA